MNADIGAFIKKMRKKKKISQQQLADNLFKDRTIISKWENNRVKPSMEDMVSLSKIFNITIEEMISCNCINKTNKNEIENNLNVYLINQDSKILKFKRILFFVISLVIILIFSFFSYYFKQTYRSFRVYRVSGKNENYEIHNGMLFLTRNNSYFIVGEINGESKKIKVYLKNDNKNILIKDGNSTSILSDNYGYNGSINLKNFDKIYNKIYVQIDQNNIIKLNFTSDYINNDLIFSTSDQIGEYMDESNLTNFEVNVNLDLVYKDFSPPKCEGEMYNLVKNDFIISYLDGTFFILNMKDKITVKYDTFQKIFVYSSNDFNFSISDFNLADEKKKNIYDYYIKYINKYIKK